MNKKTGFVKVCWVIFVAVSLLAMVTGWSVRYLVPLEYCSQAIVQILPPVMGKENCLIVADLQCRLR